MTASKKGFIVPVLMIMIVILLGVIGYLTLGSESNNQISIQTGHELINERLVPHIELKNDFSVDSKNIVTGSVTGFILFSNTEDQPRTFSQYVKIQALNKFDEKGNQLFAYYDIIKMDELPIKYFDPVIVRRKNISENIIVLTDIGNNLTFINTKTNEVNQVDASGDKTKLITNNLEYTEFMSKFLSENPIDHDTNDLR